MLNLLREMNEAVGKTMPDEVYDLTPKEVDYILAGGYQRSYNALIDNRFVVANTIVPAALAGPKADTSEADNVLKKRRNAINAITDEKLQKQMEDERKQKQRFIDIFM